MLYSLRYEEISKQYKEIKEMLSTKEEKESYAKDWGGYLAKLKGIDGYLSGKGTTNGFELGPLYYFLKQIRTKSSADPLADTLRSEIEKNMTE